MFTMDNFVLVETSFYRAYQCPSKGNIIVIDLINGVASDAACDRRPSNTIRHVDEDGTVNYFEEAPEETQNRWKRTLGQMLTKYVIKPEVLRRGMQWTGNTARSILLHFPTGYKLYTQKKGDRHDPRKDSYLIGSQFIKAFRSPQEFFLHAKWLMEGCPTKSSGGRDCGCRYCCPAMTQGEISRKYGFIATPARSNSPRDKGKEKEKEKEKEKVKKPYQMRATIPGTVIRAKDYTKLNAPSASV